jgi:uncharacterized membrane protein YqjE
MADVMNTPEEARIARDPAERLAMLADDAVEHAKELVRAELNLARDELKKEAKAAAFSLALVAASLVLIHTGFLVLVAALILAFAGNPVATTIIGIALMALAVGAALAAMRAFKRRHLPRTRRRLAQDAQALLRFRHE